MDGTFVEGNLAVFIKSKNGQTLDSAFPSLELYLLKYVHMCIKNGIPGVFIVML